MRSGSEVGLNGAGDDVDRGPLGGHDEMDARGARHLRQPLDRALDILAGDHHEVGHFVDDDHDIGQFVEGDVLDFIDRFAGLTRSKPVWTVRVSASPLAIASATRALKPSMLRTPTFDIFL